MWLEKVAPDSVLQLCATERDRFMGEDGPDMMALLKGIAKGPKRDNGVYHKAIAEARQAFENAEIALGGPVRVKTRTKMKRSGEYIVKWTFKRAK